MYNRSFCNRVLDVRDSSAISDGASDFVNEPEAIVIIKILSCMLHAPSLVGKRIVILAPYEKTINLFPILHRRPEVRLAQNSEMDIVLIFCVKTDFNGKPELLNLSGYWQLAYNGAIESVFICGNLKALDTVEVLKGFIADANHRQVPDNTEYWSLLIFLRLTYCLPKQNMTIISNTALI
uniref:Uncharacterized protein n=1 Tax=Daphnia galeata TaxID=27404 RepID=A0A8J2RM74_9CRUS|nr:unnamed protein product [Daphnia galeata]